MRTCFRSVCTLVDANPYSPFNDSVSSWFSMNFFHHLKMRLFWPCYSYLWNCMLLQNCGCTWIQLLLTSIQQLNLSDISYATFVTSHVLHFPLFTFQRKQLLAVGWRSIMQLKLPQIPPMNTLAQFPFQLCHPWSNFGGCWICKTVHRRCTFKLNMAKVHFLGNYVRTIKLFGTTDSYSTQMVHLYFLTQ